MESKTTAIARVNNVDITIIENGEKRVAVKPICDALGIDSKTQIDRIKTDPILGSVGGFSPSTGSDGKTYEMFTIPLEFVFGWLFLIDSRNVKPESREAVLRYQKECYHALYRYFTKPVEYLKYRQKRMEESFGRQFEARTNFATAKNMLADANEDFKKWMTYTEDDYQVETAQLQLFAKEEGNE